MNCKQCGAELTQTEGRRKKEFCGNTCRSNFWYKNSKKKKQKYVVNTPAPKPNVNNTPKEPPMMNVQQWINKKREIESDELYAVFLEELDEAYYLSTKQKNLIKTTP